jgi:Ca-activated chloride channel family protein
MKIFAALIALTMPCAFIWLTGASLAGYVLLGLGFAETAARFFDDPAQKGIAFYQAERWDEAADAFAKAALNSPATAYNLGNALAQAHRYKEAVAAYDLALAAVPDNQDAAFNKALLGELIEMEQISGSASTGTANSAVSRTRSAHDGDQTEAETRGSGDGFAGAQEGASNDGAPGSSKAAKSSARNNPSSRAEEGMGSAGSAEGIGRTGGQLVDFAKLFQERERRYRRRLEERSIVPTLEWLSTLPDDPGRFLKLRILAEKARRSKTSPAPEQDDD